MRKDLGDDVAAVARRRLELLGRELALAGQGPAAHPEPEPEAEPEPESVVIAAPAVIPEPGRHLRGRAPRGWLRAGAGLQERLPEALRGRVGLLPSHLPLLAVLVAVAIAGTAWWTLRSAADPVAVPMAHVSPGPEPTAAPASPSPPAVPGEVVVDVAGKVRRPGVTTLPAGSRVIDALKRAGGARAGVDLSSLNLARVLVDGEQILVGSAPAGGATAGGATAGPPAPGGGSRVSLNTGTLDQLDTLPGVGPVTAQKILDWRTEHGSFTAIDELLEVDGIGAKTFEEIAPHVTL